MLQDYFGLFVRPERFSKDIITNQLHLFYTSPKLDPRLLSELQTAILAVISPDLAQEQLFLYS